MLRSPLALSFLVLACAASLVAATPSVIPLWPEGVPGAPLNGGTEYIQDDRVYNVQVPSLTLLAPPAGTANRTAVIICPGGGYARLAVSVEGNPTAQWLNSLGVTCFILKYRMKEFGHPAPLRDVLRAVRLVRSRAAEFGVDPERIGVFGSSAGGHLASCAATLFDHAEGKTGHTLDAVSARPAFVILQYPVILMDGPHLHRGSRENLIGKNPTAGLVGLLSTDRQVTAQSSPAFLVHTAEDVSVPLENSVAFFTALRRAGVPAELHLYEKGPHGFGMRRDLGPTSEWPGRCASWMRSHGWVK
ncbi:MAG: alpha/beta hydrolase [Opitutus sp.]|nr:alpha/beta hydrolase [Opitutus sp.]